MARKSRRRSQNRPRPRPQGPSQPQPEQAQPPAAAGAPDTAASAASVPNRPSAGPRVGGEAALVRAVEMSLAPAAAGPRRGRGGFVLESGDAAIPLDRVPYFTGDLKRLGITAVVMIALLVIAAVTVIPQLVK